MKRFILGLTIAFLLSSLVYSQTENPTEVVDEAIIENAQVTPTTEAEETMKWYSEETKKDSSHTHHNRDWRNHIAENGMEMVVAIVAIVFTFLFPAIIIFIVYFFRYKNRKEQYRLAEQALASGQPIPPGLFKTDLNKSMRSKGINNIFTGLGLFIFLWSLTRFGIATIGLLIMFMGFGQVIIHYTAMKEEEKDSATGYSDNLPSSLRNKASDNDTFSSTEE